MELLLGVTEDPNEWVVPAPPKLSQEQEKAIADATEKVRSHMSWLAEVDDEQAKTIMEEMKKDPEKMKELEKVRRSKGRAR